jgi:hypothetical protein
MHRTLIVCASHHGVELETAGCIAALEKRGARVLSSTGIADVALARNHVLTLALSHIGAERAKGDTAPDVLLLVDDDMVWTPEAAAKLVSLARESGEAWSAAYATKDGHLAATPLDWNAHRTDGLRMVGLGFCAVRVARLESLARRLGAVVGPKGTQVVPFCESRTVTPEHDGIPRWCSEDYWLCRALGGVRLAPYVAAGHLKKVPLWPDSETLKLLAEGVPLPAEPPQKESPPQAEAPSEPPPAPAPEPITNPQTPAAKKQKKRSKRNGATQARP